MDQHPVPQNVTAFEFHLVGDMTLKQFGYLAAGLIIAYFTYVLIAPLNWIIAAPIILFSAASGAAFAFLPILDRPLDHWVAAYFKAVYSTSEGRWNDPSNPKKKIESSDPNFKNRLTNFLSQIEPIPSIPKAAPAVIFPTQPQAPAKTASLSPNSSMAVPKKLDLSKIPASQAAPSSISEPKPSTPISPSPANMTTLPLASYSSTSPQLTASMSAQTAQPLPSFSSHNAPTQQTTQHLNLPSPDELNKLILVARQTHLLQTRIIEIEKELALLKTNGINQNSTPAVSLVPQPPPPNTTSQPKFQQMVSSLQNLVKQTEELHHQSEIITKTIPHVINQNVVVVKPENPTQQVPALTSSPNVINGIVTDIAGNYLDGVIIIIHNKSGLPVRALKTNKLGQFAGATPLSDGVYNVTLEKEALEFDTLQITLEGKVLPPLLVQPKGGGIK